MEPYAGESYLLHVVGRADLGVPVGEPDHKEQDLIERIGAAAGPALRSLLRLELPEQCAGRTAPLAAALGRLPEQLRAAGRLHLLLVCTKRVRPIAEAVQAALRREPDGYGREFDTVTVLCADTLEETAVTGTVFAYLRPRARPLVDRALMTWGSGATQATPGALDAVLEVGLPWSLLWTHPERDTARHEVFDPSKHLSIDTLVPLLRRWRYHDLLWQLAQSDKITLTDPQRAILAREAEHWGRVYLSPTAERLRVVMAAALMRRDASSGFAVRAYVTQRYRELLRPGEPDLLALAEGRLVRGHPTLGMLVGEIQRMLETQQVRGAKDSPAGRWLMSDVVGKLNQMGKVSSHELKAPSPPMLTALRDHLAELSELAAPEEVTHDQLAGAGLSPVNLVPSMRAWYIAIVPPPNAKGISVVEQIAQAICDPDNRLKLDLPVRRYVGIPDWEQLPIGLFLLGTRSASAEAAHALAGRWRDTLPTAAAIIEDHPALTGVEPDAVTVGGLVAELREALPPDVGVLVLVPTGPKEYVLPLLLAGQVIAAERGIPYYLRQLVSKGEDVITAGIHRLPMRFGADRAMLHAVLHALDGGELDTAGRLLGAVSIGQELGERLLALACALRCDRDQRSAWPKEVRRDRSSADLDGRLLAQRIEVWATRPRLADDATAGMRAIVGACASAEASLSRSDRPGLRHAVRDLYAVRDRLPITHGCTLGEGGLAGLVSDATGGRYGTVADLLAGAVADARDRYGTPAGSGSSLSQLLEAIRTEIEQLLASERDQRRQ